MGRAGTATRHSSVLGHDNQNERIWSRLTAVTRCLGGGTGPRTASGPMALSAASELRAPRDHSASPQPLAGPAAWQHPALQRVPGIQCHQPPPASWGLQPAEGWDQQPGPPSTVPAAARRADCTVPRTGTGTRAHPTGQRCPRLMSTEISTGAGGLRATPQQEGAACPRAAAGHRGAAGLHTCGGSRAGQFITLKKSSAPW